MNSRVALICAALLTGCNHSVHDLTVTSDPLVVIHGHVDLGSLMRSHPEAPLVGGLIWAGLPQINPLCLKFPVPDIAPACPDPYGVFYGEVELAAPIDANGDFDLPLFHLPKASVSIGDAVTRVAYGSLIVAEDVNGNGEFSFALPDRGFGGDDPSPPPPDANTDVIVAATFDSLLTDQQRIVFREGGFVADSNFYPAPGCPAPPPGFSIQVAPPYMSGGPCAFRSTDTPTTVSPITATDSLALMCRQVGATGPDGVRRRAFRNRDAAEQRPDSNEKSVCLSPEVLASVPSGACPVLIGFLLKGCDQDPFCTTPSFDHTASPPDWWPCH